MRKYTALVIVLIFSLFFIQPLFAAESRNRIEDQLKGYINEIAQKIQTSEEPAAKREILNEALINVINTFERMDDAKYLSRKNRDALSSLKQDLQDKYNELNGLEGFQKIADQDLDSFALYVLQDLEQARNYITMSLGIFILIIVLILILA